jgi:AraC family transcriptional regulator
VFRGEGGEGSDLAFARHWPSWRLPQRRVLSHRDWGRFSASIYDRGAGEGIWEADEHRLVYSLTPRPAMLVQVHDGPVRDLPAEPEPIGFYPAGVRARTIGPGSRYAQICWDPSLYATIAPQLPRRPEMRPELCQDPLIGQLARTLASEIGAGTADRLLAESLVAAIAMRLLHRQGALSPAQARVPDMARPRLRRVLDHIEANLGAELTLAELADIACLNPFHLSKSFKAAMGVGPQRYVTQRRVERAKALLRDTATPLVAIAQDLGFSDQSHFTNVFRRETGVTPARFRAAAAG